MEEKSDLMARMGKELQVFLVDPHDCTGGLDQHELRGRGRALPDLYL